MQNRGFVSETRKGRQPTQPSTENRGSGRVQEANYECLTDCMLHAVTFWGGGGEVDVAQLSGIRRS